MTRPFDLVVFDLGGVLIRHARSWEEMHERAGLDGDPPSGDDWRRGWTNIEKLLETGAIDLDVGHRRMAAASRGPGAAFAVATGRGGRSQDPRLPIVGPDTPAPPRRGGEWSPQI